jgi:hypothetical protein
LLGLPFRAVGAFGSSLFQGVGIAAGSRVAQGFGNATNSQLTQLGGFIDKKINDALKTGTIGLSKAAGYGSTRQFRSDASSFFDAMFDYSPKRVKKAYQKAEDRMVDVLESLIVNRDVAKAKNQFQDFLAEYTGGLRKTAVGVAGAGVRVGAQPFRVRKRVELARTIKEAESMVDDVIARMDDRLKAEIKKASGVTIATGGVDFDRGQNAYFSANLVRKLTPGNVTIPFVNSRGNDPNNPGSFYNLRSSIGMGGEKPMPIDRFLSDALITGRNPDASSMLAQVMAVRKLTDKPITLTGSSGGSALVE